MIKRRNTVVSKTVMTFLESSSKPVSIKNIIGYLESINIQPNKSTIYRLMEKLLEDQVVTSNTVNNGTVYFELTKHKHNHFFCEVCKKLFCLDDDRQDQTSFYKLLPNNAFKIHSYELNIYGVCDQC